MKSVKKQANAKEIKNPGIQTFFRSVPKTFVVEKDNDETKNDVDDPKKFYIDLLREKLRRPRDGTENEVEVCDLAAASDKEVHGHGLSTELQVEPKCQDAKTVECDQCVRKDVDIEEWRQKYEDEVLQRKELKKVDLNLTVRFSELHSKYEDLLKATTKIVAVDPPEDDSATPEDSIFTETEAKFLSCMALDKRHDCTFVLHCLKYAYKNDLSVLALKTLKGTAKSIEIMDDGEKIYHKGKDPITPKKVDRIRGLFIERISKCKIDAADYSERMKETYLNKLFAAGIKNLSKKKL
ncbi:hypothetical protein Bhyg_03060 [Pseudolycoriella hygida]|uniref:Uncharacterized protein n=1 Tax=Pseudolycoriella hygida TaxID=35572 RepID=A0A9Q0NCK4_9DIPT|nr:hypothetical protein Bhyg_03060 [Pseudolycoriella hygida]